MENVHSERVLANLEPEKYKRVIAWLINQKRSRLPRQPTYGRVHLLEWARHRTSRGYQHYCECPCGFVGLLDSPALRLSRKLDEGCLRWDCTATSQATKLWFNAKFSMRRQWANYLFSNPFNVDQVWGGQLYPGTALVGEEQAFHNFWEFVQPQIDIYAGSTWVMKLDRRLPLVEGNVVIRRVAPKYFGRWNFLNFGGAFLDYKTVASMLLVRPEMIAAVHERELYSMRVLELLGQDNQRAAASVQILPDQRKILVEGNT